MAQPRFLSPSVVHVPNTDNLSEAQVSVESQAGYTHKPIHWAHLCDTTRSASEVEGCSCVIIFFFLGGGDLLGYVINDDVLK